MKIIAFDPGNVQSAYVAWDTKKDDFIPGCRNRGLIDNESILTNTIYHLLGKALPDMVAIEMIQSYGMGVGRTTFETVLFIGRLIQVITDSIELDPTSNRVLIPSIELYGRPTIKAQVGGKNDAQIRTSLRFRYGEAKKGEKLEGVKKDIWSALALACALTENPGLKKW